MARTGIVSTLLAPPREISLSKIYQSTCSVRFGTKIVAIKDLSKFNQKDQAKKLAREKAIDKKNQAIANLRRMRYSGEADDDSWYFAEMQTLEDALVSLQKQRNDAEYRARDWRAMADETFTFARYAKEDFDGDDLEKKRSVIVKLGEILTIKDRTIKFTPNKYFIPLETMNEQNNSLNMVRIANNSSAKTKTDAIASVNNSWLRRSGSNRRPIR